MLNKRKKLLIGAIAISLLTLVGCSSSKNGSNVNVPEENLPVATI